MADHIIIIIAILFIYYHIGGLATTNILRLTAGNSLAINSSKCVCDTCGSPISPLLQLPIISYVVCKGKCKECGAKIPMYPLILEIIIFVGMSLITTMLKFTPIGIVGSYAYYECIRIVLIVSRGKRKTHFAKQYIIAMVSMTPFLLFSLFASVLYSIV